MTASQTRTPASEKITLQIASLADWRGKKLAQLREIILQADPAILEEWKWGTAVWSHNGIVCSAGAFKDHVKLFFFKGASLKDPKINGTALKDLIRSAAAFNLSGGKK